MTGDELPRLAVQQGPVRNLAARLEGILAVNAAANCLVIQKAGRDIEVAWRPGTSVGIRDGSIALIDAAGQMIAKLGDTVILGGGYVPPSVAHTSSYLGNERVFAIASPYLSSTDSPTGQG